MHGVHRWKLAVPTAALGPDATIENIIAEARQVGFDAVEPTLGLAGDLTVGNWENALRKLGQRLQAASLAVSALFLAETRAEGLPDDDRQISNTAAGSIRAGLRAAALVGTDTLILTLGGMADRDRPRAAFACEIAFQRTLEAMLHLRFDAQRCAIHLALRLQSPGLPSTPQEARDFLDRINSPWIGCCLDLGRPETPGDAADWIETLGHRLRSVRLLQCHETAPRTVLDALRRAGYSGPITCLNADDDLADVVSRIRAALG